jgi:hypothetical protein
MLITVEDDADLHQVIAFARSECRLKLKEPFLAKVRCNNADNTEKAVFKNVPFAPDVYKFAIRARKLSILPFLRDRVRATLTVGTIDRPDWIGDIRPCDIKHGVTKERLKCVEPAR